MEFYHLILMKAPEAESARQYLHQRGFTSKTLQELKIGFAQDRWDTVLNKARYRYGKDSIKILQTASLISERRSKTGHYDYFRNRIMFPIFDNFGKTIGFGGRALKPDDEIKYLNSREIKKIFEKSKTLYLLNLAQREAMRTGHLLMMEGYTDAALARQQGLKNTFATAGTALTPDHALMLKRITDKIIICMDADNAGRKASIDAAMLLLNTGINVELILLPDKKDPAEVILEEGDRFKHRIDSAVSLFDFALEDAVKKHNISSTHNKAIVLKELEPVLRAAPDAITCHAYIHAAAKRLDVPFETAARAVEASRQHNKPIELTPFLTTEQEHRIASILLRRPAYRNEIMTRLLPEHFKNNEIRALFMYFRETETAKGDLITSNHRLSKTPSLFDSQYTENLPRDIIGFARKTGLPAEESKLYSMISRLQRTPAPDTPINIIINSMLKAHYRHELNQMEEQIQDAGIRKDQKALEKLMQNYQKTLQEYHKLSLSNKD
ncbi:toprim domain-containing protein [Candidatus Woesearchaeota archaeon]|nr:toprim domain-containing protein [Candidatus Woesearchaeota archaeon]MBW3005545.1 toprim domain-containing protein [Candidatus Woesearchaeota archaeon]